MIAKYWQPIEALPLIACMLDGQLQNVRQQVSNVEQCQHRPQVLDAAMIARIQTVFDEQRSLLPVFREQLSRWREMSREDAVQLELNRLDAVLDQMKDSLDRILKLTEDLSRASRS